MNHAFYTAAIAGAVLIALDLPHPSNLDPEGRRILVTFVGVAIAVIVNVLAGLLKKGKASAAAPQTERPPAERPWRVANLDYSGSMETLMPVLHAQHTVGPDPRDAPYRRLRVRSP